jgi:hypothetical protein
LREEGFEVFRFDGVANSFIRNVHIYNADEAIATRNGAFITVKDVHVLATREPVAVPFLPLQQQLHAKCTNILHTCTISRSRARQRH